ncbi:cold shock domain-containing protein [Vibrio pectenicida]|uniref:Cold shock domain-containing protein n=1 Tax=Vibrio pectenicida TaxID=62763 RepID=A0A3R9F601_9VIBR|nr:cold shock domain-containing protein [Vibrio pectenicida]
MLKLTFLGCSTVLGVIIKWDEKHRYGLISTRNLPTQKVFFHVRDMSTEEGPPYVSEQVEFDVLRDMNGCKMATNINPVIIKFKD